MHCLVLVFSGQYLLYPKTLPDLKIFQNTMFVLSAIVLVHTYSWSLLNSL